MHVLYPQPLTRTAFAPFGDVIETDQAQHYPINDGWTERFHDLAQVQFDSGGRPLVSIFRSTPLPLPHPVRVMERHPLGSQAFMPLGGEAFLILVAAPGDSVTASTLRLFVSNGRQGVNYHRNVWHHPVLAVGRVTDFLIVDRGGPGDNCDELHFASPLALIAAPTDALHQTRADAAAGS